MEFLIKILHLNVKILLQIIMIWKLQNAFTFFMTHASQNYICLVLPFVYLKSKIVRILKINFQI